MYTESERERAGLIETEQPIQAITRFKLNYSIAS